MDILDDTRPRDTELGSTLGTYMRQTRTKVNELVAAADASAVVEHSELTGLTDDDHLQYHNDSRAATWHTALSGDHISTVDQAKLDGLVGPIPDQLSDLTDDATHRLVTDTEKSTWNSKVAGGNAQVQYNDAGTLGADANFTWDDVAQSVNVGQAVILPDNP